MKLISYLFVALASSSEVNITFDSNGRFRIPISARMESSGEEVAASVFLDLHQTHGFSYGRRLHQSIQTDRANAYSIVGQNDQVRHTVATERVRIPTDPEGRFWDRASIGAGLFSRFAWMFNFIITPTDRASGLLVLNPATPESYAFHGQWFYVNSVHPELAQIMASVVVGNDTNGTSPDVFSLVSESDVTWVPHETFLKIVRHLEMAGFTILRDGAETPISTRPVDSTSVGQGRLVHVTGNIESLISENIRIPESTNAAELAQVLPPIYFDVTSRAQTVRIALFPEDYIFTDQEEIFILIGARMRGLYSIGTNVLRRLALHMDSRNRRIGFADPVNEI